MMGVIKDLISEVRPVRVVKTATGREEYKTVNGILLHRTVHVAGTLEIASTWEPIREGN